MAEQPGQNLVSHPIVEEMQDSYLRYAMSVIISRALPDVRDGLKPSQRRILVAMNDLKVGPRSAHLKCAKITGQTMGEYHPHGDMVIYPTLVRMAQPFSLRYPLIDGQGNFGSVDGDAPAQMRYTEARMASTAMEMLEDLDKDTVDFIPTFDERSTEPTVLPAKFPNLLVNGSTGIAVGMATNLPPHNLGEICDGLIALVNNPDITIDELMQHVKGPDFPTGAMICGRQGIRDAYTRGRGSVVLRAKLHVEDMKGDRKRIVVDEIPYGILRLTIVERIAACVKEGKLSEVSYANDHSDRKHAVRIVVECKHGVNEEVVINKLYQFTPLQTNYTIINIALVGKQPQTLSLKELMQCHLDHRKEVITRRTRFLLRKARQRAHVVEGLMLAIPAIDEIIQRIKSSRDPAEAKQRLLALRFQYGFYVGDVGQGLQLPVDPESELQQLVNQFREQLKDSVVRRLFGERLGLTGVQVDAILAMQLQRLTGLEIQKLAREYGSLLEEIEGYEAVLRDPALLLDIIREDIFEMKSKYADARRTEIVGAVGEFKMEELIEDAPMMVTISHEGYIKRVPQDTYRSQGRGGRGIRGGEAREGDFIQDLFAATTHDYLLFFTNRGRVYWLKVYDVPEMNRTARGRAIVNLLKVQEGEQIMAVVPVSKFEEKFVMFCTAKGTVKKTALGAFSNPRPSGIIAIGLDPDDTLIHAELVSDEDEVVLGTREGMAVRFKHEDARAMGRSAGGVKGITLKKDDRVVDMAVIRPGMSLLTICENGYGKRTEIEEYRMQRRGGSGVINIRATDRNGEVVALKAVTDADGLMIITAKGIMLRTGVAQMREIGRATQGVRVIRLDEGDKVVAVARVAKEDEEETPAGEGGAGPVPESGETASPSTAEAVEPSSAGDAGSSDLPDGDGAADSGDAEPTDESPE